MKHKSIKFIVLTIMTILFFSCGSRKNIVYMDNIDSTKNYDISKQYEPILQPDDLLSIIISAENPEITVPFNLPQIQGNYEINNNQNGIKTYLIDNAGFIDFPVIGKIKLSGLTRTEANNKLAQKVSEYIKNPGINLRILNYKISVIGEVTRPGSFTIPNERITILEALSLAGDMTIYGVRKNVLIIREIEGKKTFNRVDITNADFLNSPFYYLAQNDVVFVEPNKPKINSSAVGQNASIILSGFTVIISLLILLK